MQIPNKVQNIMKVRISGWNLNLYGINITLFHTIILFRPPLDVCVCVPIVSKSFDCPVLKKDPKNSNGYLPILIFNEPVVFDTNVNKIEKNENENL